MVFERGSGIEELLADEPLVAVGRAPNVEGLGQMHLGMCSHCRAYLGQMRQTLKAVGKVKVEEATPPEVRDELLKRFQGWKRSKGKAGGGPEGGSG